MSETDLFMELGRLRDDANLTESRAAELLHRRGFVTDPPAMGPDIAQFERGTLPNADQEKQIFVGLIRIFSDAGVLDEAGKEHLEARYNTILEHRRTLQDNHTPKGPYALQVKHLNVHFGKKQVLKDISLSIPEGKVTALVGGSGSGKTTLIRAINRLYTQHDATKKIMPPRIDGEVLLKGQNTKEIHDMELRTAVGFVFQQPTALPGSIFHNVAFGLKLQKASKEVIAQKVEESLKKVGLWEMLKDRLHDSPATLSGGQLQRLCIARAIILDPPVLLMDEPTSALDDRSKRSIETLIHQLKGDRTVVIITHDLQQAGRVSDYTALLKDGKLLQYGTTPHMFSPYARPKTKKYFDETLSTASSFRAPIGAMTEEAFAVFLHDQALAVLQGVEPATEAKRHVIPVMAALLAARHGTDITQQLPEVRNLLRSQPYAGMGEVAACHANHEEAVMKYLQDFIELGATPQKDPEVASTLETLKLYVMDILESAESRLQAQDRGLQGKGGCNPFAAILDGLSGKTGKGAAMRH